MTALNAIHREARMVMRAAQILERAGIVDTEEFSSLLGVFSEVVAETTRAEGDILALWADVVRDNPPPGSAAALRNA